MESVGLSVKESHSNVIPNRKKNAVIKKPNQKGANLGRPSKQPYRQSNQGIPRLARSTSWKRVLVRGSSSGRPLEFGFLLDSVHPET